jgi:hypothetical protein
MYSPCMKESSVWPLYNMYMYIVFKFDCHVF